MKVRAIAAKDPRSNTVGTVEIEAHAEGLVLIHVGASAFSEGYVPSTPTQHTGLFVPWSQVRTASIEDDQLFLAIDPDLSPLNRLVLRGFSTQTAVDHRELYRRRLIIRLAVVAALLVVVLLAFVVAPRATQDRPLLVALSISTVAASLLLTLGFAADKWLIGGNAAALRDRTAFFAELALYLPRTGQRPDRPTSPRDPRSWPLIGMAERLVPRSTTAIVIALSASILAALLTGKWLFTQQSEQPLAAEIAPGAASPTPLAPVAPPTAQFPPAQAVAPNAVTPVSPAVPPPTAPAPAAPVAAAVPLTGPCRCERSESILWRNALPKLSPVLIEQNVKPHNNHTHLELELGIVNNSDQVLKEITLDLQFYEDKPGAKTRADRSSSDTPNAKDDRNEKKHQALYFEGPLRPGQAIKWHVEGRGTSFEVNSPHHETLDPNGKDAAPAAAFEELLSKANHRPIRLHGAMMLAALGHEQRAREGALSLREALREDEAPYIDRLLSATGPIATCQLAVSEGSALRRVRACVHNRATNPAADVTLRVRALDRLFDHRNPVAPPPIVIAEQLQRLSAPLAANSGQLVTLDLDTTNPDSLRPETFEVLIDDNAR